MAEKHKSKYKAPKDLEKSQKPKPRKDLKDYTVEDKDEKLNPNSTGEKQKNVLRKTDKPVIDNGSIVPDMKDADRAYKSEGEHDPKHSAKVMSKRQDDDEKDSEDSIKDKIENLTREQKERLVREMIRRRIKAVLKEQEEPEEEPAAEEPAPEPEAPAEEPTPAPAPAETPEAPAPEPEADAPAEEPAADAAPKQDSTAQLNSFVTLVKNQPTSPEQIKMILKAVQKTGTMTDEQGNEVMNQGKLKELYRYLKIAADRMLEKYS
jgi:hypothetical protein